MMACRGCLECLLKLLNFLLTLVGLAMVGYGIYLFVEYKRAEDTVTVSPVSGDQVNVQLGRPMLLAVSLSSNILDKLPKAWFIYLFIGVGVVLFVISCFGCIGAASRNGCCLACYSVLVVFLILVELGCAAFLFFDKSWKDEIPTDKTGDFDMIYDFLKEHWSILRWVAIGVVVLEVDRDTAAKSSMEYGELMGHEILKVTNFSLTVVVSVRSTLTCKDSFLWPRVCISLPELREQRVLQGINLLRLLTQRI